MSFRIAHNVEAQRVNRNLAVSANQMAESMKRLSTGLRINSAKDDAAGLAISEKMRAQIRGLEVAERNVQDGISLLNTMEAALNEVHSILHRARDLAVRWNSGTLTTDDKRMIRNELTQLSNEIERIERATVFNGIPILQDALLTIDLQVGANDGETVMISMVDLFGAALELVLTPTFGPVPWLQSDVQGFDAHISDVANARGRIGAQVNRLEHILLANQQKRENLMAAESRIRDVDMARELTTMTRHQVAMSSGQTVALFANQKPSRVLDLLGMGTR